MRRALTVGINHYKWGPLSGCINDAKNMANVLSRDYDGKHNFHVKQLTSDKFNVSKAQLFKDITDLFEREADIVVFYFSGHGATTKLGGFLVTQDSQKYDPGLSLNEIMELANMATHIKEIVIIVDACHSGHAGNTNPLNKEISCLRKGISVLASSLQTEYSWENNGQGLFTQIVVEAIKGGGANIMGQVTIAGIYDYVDKALGPWQQRPVFKSHLTQLNTISSIKPQISNKKLRLLGDYFENPEFEIGLSPEFEPTAEPKSDEKEEIFSFLQQCRACNLVEPVDEEHMYYAAMNSKSCRLTSVGKLYWKMIKLNKV